MGASTIISGGLGLAGGLYNTIQGAKDKRDAADALAAYERQELTNVADGLQVSTLGSDLERQEQARLASTQVSALQSAGARGLIGGLGRVEAGNQMVMAKTGANLDMQQKDIDQMRAQDQARIRQMQENREIQDIDALSSQYNAGKNQQMMGMGNIVQASGMIGQNLGGLQGQPREYQQESPIATAGMTTIQGAQIPIYGSVMPNSTFGTSGNGMFKPYEIPNQR